MASTTPGIAENALFASADFSVSPVKSACAGSVVSYPIERSRSTMSFVEILHGSYRMPAVSDAKLTAASLTPGNAARPFSIREAQAAQVIPRIGNSNDSSFPGLFCILSPVLYCQY